MKGLHGLLACLGFLLPIESPSQTIEAESMTLSGGYLNTIASPFSGIRFYSNGEVASKNISSTLVSGQYTIVLRGASATANSASLAIYLNQNRQGTVQWNSTSISEQSISISLQNDVLSPKLELKMESDNGSSDADLDWIKITHGGAILPPPPGPIVPTIGAFQTKVHRNLFVESGKTTSEVHAKISGAFDQLFHGDSATERLYFENSDGSAYILDVGNNDVRSEGMSYGMMICVQMNKKTEFDRLWKFAYEKMLHKSGEQKGYFSWQMNRDGSVRDANPAPDGEAYFVMSLLFASNRWGDGSGYLNYNAQAQQILNDMLHQSDDGQGVNMFSAGKQVVFSTIGSAALFTDPSYHLPAFYELWALWANSDKEFWKSAADTSRSFWKRTVNSTTGLAPDYAEFSGSPNNTGNHGDFRFDAWRVIHNAAMDYSWWAKDPWQKSWCTNLQSFFIGQGINAYANQYSLNGTALSTDHSPGLVAMNAVASLAIAESSTWQFVDALWNTDIPTGQWRYYDGMLTMLGLLHVSGEFRIWEDSTGTTPVKNKIQLNTLKRFPTVDFDLLGRVKY